MSIGGALARGFQKVVSSRKGRRGAEDKPTNDEINEPQEPEDLEPNSMEGNEADPANSLFPFPTAIASYYPPPSSVIPQNILAFRFITSRLALIDQSPQPFKSIDNLSSEGNRAAGWASRERKEVRICDALAHLAAAEYNIVAISTNWHQTYGRRPTLGIIATAATFPDRSHLDLEEDLAQDLDDTQTGDLDKQPEDDDIFGGIAKWGKGISKRWRPTKWNISFTDNAQTDKHILNKRNSKGKGLKDDTIPPDLFPDIDSTPNVPANFQSKYNGNIDVYMGDLLSHWQEPTLSRHLWILGKLLTPPPKEATSATLVQAQLKQLYKYTVAICCKKMDQRFKSPRSQTYYNALVKVDTNKFTFKPSSQSRDEPLHDPELKAENDLEVEIKNDIYFLTLLVYMDDHPPTKAGSLPYFSEKFPNILWKARNMPSTKQRYSFYDKTTYIEFHLLLLDLLACFKKTVHLLSELRKSDLHTDSDNAARFKTNVDRGRLYGYLLMRLARGRVFKQHVENIELLLSDCILPATNIAAQSIPKPVFTPVPDKGIETANIDEETEVADRDIDEEIDAMEGIPPEKGLLSKAYGSWLRLMAIHLDGAEITVDFVNDPQFPFTEISITMLVPPKTSSKVLPWRDLFKSAGVLFPKSDPLALNGPTNAKLEEFLARKIQDATFATTSNELVKKANKSWHEKNFSQTLDALKELKLLTYPNEQSEDLVTKLIKAIETEQARDYGERASKWSSLRRVNPPKQLPDSPSLRMGIEPGDIGNNITRLNAIYTIPAGSAFFMDFAKEDNFGGTLHCEAFMATLLDNAAHPETYNADWNLHENEMKEYGKVIGVSKRCCPACFHFLDLIAEQHMEQEGDEQVFQPFRVRGSHANVSGCTLPLWTPSHIVDDMNAAFGTHLRKALIDLMPAVSFRSRLNSGGSQTLSINSGERHQDATDQQSFTSLEGEF